MSRWNEWVLLVCDMEKYKRPALQQEPIVYLGPKWLRYLQCCSGLQLIGPAHEDLRQCLGQALRLEVILLSKEKVAAPRPKPRGRPRQASRQASREVLREASRQVSRQASRQASGLEAGLEAQGGKPSKPSTPFKTLQTFQNPPNPPNTFPNRHPKAKATSQSGPPGPRPQQWLSIGFQSCRLPARQHSKCSKTLQTLQNPPNLQAWRHALSRWPKGYGS